MKIALFGATGMIGQRVLNEALSRGHQVTAIARNPSKITVQNENVTPVAGDIFDTGKVAEIVAGHDAVISATSPSHDAPETAVDAVKSLLAGLRQAGVKRVVIVGGAGSLQVAAGLDLVDAPDFPAAWKPVALVHRDILNDLKAEGGDLDWTYLSPAAFIQPGERTGKFRLGTDQLVTDEKGESRISAEDYAIALVDEVEKPAHLKQRFTVAY